MTIQGVAGRLDELRAGLLRRTLEVPALREVFRDRARRLFALSVCSWAMSLALSLAFPLWVLALGPVIYGVPHVFASVRYFHHAAGSRDDSARRRAYAVLFLITAALAAYRLATTQDPSRLSEWRGAGGPELVSLGLTFLAGLWVYRRTGARTLRGALFLTPFVLGLILAPYATIGILVLLHNFVGFAYWYRIAGRPAEKRAACGAFGLALLATAVVLGGGMDRFVGGGTELAFARLGFAELGAMIFPWGHDPHLGMRAAVVYAFGQSLHYFVWLKAIPDQCHTHEVPTSFREGARLLERDFGALGLRIALSLSFLGAAVWLWVSFYQARLIYFALAGYHGYLEIAGLALAFCGRRS